MKGNGTVHAIDLSKVNIKAKRTKIGMHRYLVYNERKGFRLVEMKDAILIAFF